MKVYHASAHEFEFPDYERIRMNRSGHANGALGLWVAHDMAWNGAFGPVMYEVDLVDFVSEDLTIKDLKDWSSEGWDFHEGIRAQAISRGVDYLRLVEQDGRSDMGIILNFDVIASFTQWCVTDSPDDRPRCNA